MAGGHSSAWIGSFEAGLASAERRRSVVYANDLSRR